MAAMTITQVLLMYTMEMVPMFVSKPLKQPQDGWIKLFQFLWKGLRSSLVEDEQTQEWKTRTRMPDPTIISDIVTDIQLLVYPLTLAAAHTLIANKAARMAFKLPLYQDVGTKSSETGEEQPKPDFSLLMRSVIVAEPYKAPVARTMWSLDTIWPWLQSATFLFYQTWFFPMEKAINLTGVLYRPFHDYLYDPASLHLNDCLLHIFSKVTWNHTAINELITRTSGAKVHAEAALMALAYKEHLKIGIYSILFGFYFDSRDSDLLLLMRNLLAVKRPLALVVRIVVRITMNDQAGD
ncbi:hypothetical protein BT96DRAFT_1087951 [Gymnopus androsaceus JB14]|uniref:Uncharacterized protein n=1 Tax=Gymnopus androsaceus JB14 TaxID=1447944 RepID=A0A6A4GKV2_9AGAR|nr:hypothetical protein BT96DRAFT_1087951 [Gymnopus androsaceus JB14]